MAVVLLIRLVLKSLVHERDTFSVKNGIYNRKELDFGTKIPCKTFLNTTPRPPERQVQGKLVNGIELFSI